MRFHSGTTLRVALLALLGAQLSCHDLSGVGQVPSALVAVSATNQNATPGTAVADPPSVLVHDQAGAPLSDVTVRFAVTSGGGSVTGGTVVTDASGVATVGSWILGPGTGVNTLTATVGSLPPITFTANGPDNPCVVSATHTIGTTSSGALASGDCQLSDGSFIDYISTTVATAGTYIFNQTSDFDTFLLLYVAAGHIIGFNDDNLTTLSTNSIIKALLPAGDFTLAASSYDPNITGAYTITSAASSATVTNCEDVFVVRGISSDQSLQSPDCANGGFNTDDYIIFLVAGEQVTISMSSTAVDSKLGIYFNSALRASNDNKDATTTDAQLTYLPPVSGFYVIAATSAAAAATGAYTIAIQ